MALVAIGVILVAGAVALVVLGIGRWPIHGLLVAGGLLLVIVFGTRAVGARQQQVGAGKEGLHATTNYAAPKPERLPERRLPLRPRSRRPPHAQRSGDTEPEED